MKFAVIETGGKQCKVQEGKSLKVEKLDAQTGGNVAFDKVLLFYDGESVLKMGKPFLSDIKVTGEVAEQKRGPKIVIFKYKPKKRYRKKQGHRQPYTLVKIISIGEEKRILSAKSLQGKKEKIKTTKQRQVISKTSKKQPIRTKVTKK